MPQFWPYPYVSHLVLLPPETAEVSFDLLCFRLAAGCRGSGPAESAVMSVRSGRLNLGRPDPATERPRGYWPCRALPGTLHPGQRWGRKIPVRLELLPWSATMSELALIAGPTHGFGLVAERRYLRLAHDLLTALVDALETAGRDDVDREHRRRGRPMARAAGNTPKQGQLPAFDGRRS